MSLHIFLVEMCVSYWYSLHVAAADVVDSTHIDFPVNRIE